MPQTKKETVCVCECVCVCVCVWCVCVVCVGVCMCVCGVCVWCVCVCVGVCVCVCVWCVCVCVVCVVYVCVCGVCVCGVCILSTGCHCVPNVLYCLSYFFLTFAKCRRTSSCKNVTHPHFIFFFPVPLTSSSRASAHGEMGVQGYINVNFYDGLVFHLKLLRVCGRYRDG
jgi:hypothetical protein